MKKLLRISSLILALAILLAFPCYVYLLYRFRGSHFAVARRIVSFAERLAGNG